MFIKKSILGIVLLIALPVVASKSSSTELSGTQIPELGRSFDNPLRNPYDADVITDRLDYRRLDPKFVIQSFYPDGQRALIELQNRNVNLSEKEKKCLVVYRFLNEYLKNPYKLTDEEYKRIAPYCNYHLLKAIKAFSLQENQFNSLIPYHFLKGDDFLF